MRLAVQGEGYTGAVGAFVGGNLLAASTCSSLANRLSGYAGMAGDDSTAADFATSYDGAASEALAALADLVGGFGSLGHLAEASLVNHHTAEVASGGRVSGPATRADESVGILVSTPPSSLGGDSPSLPGPVSWVLDQIEGFVWPDADTDRLRTAAATWRSAAESVSVLTSYCDEALSAFADELSPEIPLAIATTQDLRSRVESLGDQFAAIGTACATYADHVDAKRAEMLDLLQELVVEIGIGAAVGLGLSLISGGLAAPAAGGAGSARVAAAARELKLIVDSLRVLTGGPALELRGAAVTTREIGAFGERLSSARVLMMEGSESSLGRGATSGPFSTGFLTRHENEYAHTLREHVGRTLSQLRQRFIEKPRLTKASTFRNQDEAEDAIERVVRMNDDRIQAWLTDATKKESFSTELGHDIGHVLIKSTGDVVASTKVRIVLIPDETMPAGWRLLTAYPEL